MHVHLTLSSRNVKTGPIPVSTTSAASCPSVCPFNSKAKGGCYAESGPLAMHWRKVTQGARGEAFGPFLDKIARLPKGQLWRHNQAGDLMGEGDTLDTVALAALVKANRGRNGFTYTHKPLTSQAERDAIRDANASGFTVNLSGNDLAHADELYDMDIGPVVVVLPANTKSVVVTPKGRKVYPCPATIRDDVACSNCGICAKLRKAIVGFPAHGTSVKKANAIALGAN